MSLTRKEQQELARLIATAGDEPPLLEKEFFMASDASESSPEQELMTKELIRSLSFSASDVKRCNKAARESLTGVKTCSAGFVDRPVSLRRRAAIVAMLLQGQTIREIAGAMDVTVSRMQTLMRRLRETAQCL